MRAFSKNKILKLRNPTYKRPWQHVLEPIAGYLLLAKKLCLKNNEKKYNGAWNFGPKKGDNLNVLQFASLFKKKMKSNSEIGTLKMYEKKEKSTLDLNSNKANKFLGWKPILSIEETLKLTADWYLANNQKKNMKSFSENQIKFYTKLINKLYTK